jgi:transcriptional regulator with XRE-family HTH domain
MLGWTQRQLAVASGVDECTIKRLERQEGPQQAYHATIVAVQEALNEAGVELLFGDAPGVRLRPKATID